MIDLLLGPVVLKTFPLPPHLSHAQHSSISSVHAGNWNALMSCCGLAERSTFSFPSTTHPTWFFCSVWFGLVWLWGPLDFPALNLSHLQLPLSSYQLPKTSLCCFKFPRLERVHTSNFYILPATITYFAASFQERNDCHPWVPITGPGAFYKDSGEPILLPTSGP